MEPQPDLYVQHIVEVYREVWRVLRDDGCAWVVIGDSYASTGGYRDYGSHDGATGRAYNSGMRANGDGLKPKDLCGIPWRVALALQADGWYLRSCCIWAKGVSFCDTYSGSCMPESVRDRPTTGHEYVFLLSKQAQYFYDADAVREPCLPSSYERDKYPDGKRQITAADYGVKALTGNMAPGQRVASNPAGRNLRSVWLINPEPLKQAHYAAYPRALVRPMILASTSQRGVCLECGSQWERVTERPDMSERPRRGNGSKMLTIDNQWAGANSAGQAYQQWRNANPDITLGWRPDCQCYPCTPWPFGNKPIEADQLDVALPLLAEYDELDTIPATVLDHFVGSGTTCHVAEELGRDSIGMDLSDDYVEMTVNRVSGTFPVEIETPDGVIEVQQRPLFSDVEVVT